MKVTMVTVIIRMQTHINTHTQIVFGNVYRDLHSKFRCGGYPASPTLLEPTYI